jgi:hypothetical protein
MSSSPSAGASAATISDRSLPVWIEKRCWRGSAFTKNTRARRTTCRGPRRSDDCLARREVSLWPLCLTYPTLRVGGRGAWRQTSTPSIDSHIRAGHLARLVRLSKGHFRGVSRRTAQTSCDLRGHLPLQCDSGRLRRASSLSASCRRETRASLTPTLGLRLAGDRDVRTGHLASLDRSAVLAYRSLRPRIGHPECFHHKRGAGRVIRKRRKQSECI